MRKPGNSHNKGVPWHRIRLLISEKYRKFCYPDEIMGASRKEGGGSVASDLVRIRNGCSKFWDLIPLLTSRGLPVGAKGRLYSTFVSRAML